FVLVLVILGKFAWGPILNTLQTRESFIREALEKAKHDRESAEARLKEDAAKMIERAKREIHIATDTATKELYTLSAKLATQLAARVIGRELTPQDHQRLISEAIAGIEGSGIDGAGRN